METSRLTGNRIREYLAEGKRFDGRKLEEFRDIEIETGISNKAEGSVRVRVGKTEVLVGVKMAVGEPYPDSQDKGNLMVTSELLPLSSPRIELGPPKFPAIEIGRLVDRAIRESKFIELEKLCIREGEKVWSVFIDVYSINDDGNLVDAAGIGAVVALKNARIPKYDEETDKVLYDEPSDKKLPLSKNMPICVTLHKIGDSIFVDPTQEEEDVSETKMTVGITEEGVISSMQKGNSREISVENLHEMLDVAEKVSKKIQSKIERFFK